MQTANSEALMPIRSSSSNARTAISNPLFDTLEDCVRFQAVIPPPRDLWTGLCLGEADMRDNYQRQKEKYCGCMHQTIFYDQPEKSIKSAVQLCKGKFPPLE